MNSSLVLQDPQRNVCGVESVRRGWEGDGNGGDADDDEGEDDERLSQEMVIMLALGLRRRLMVANVRFPVRWFPYLLTLSC